MKKLIDTIIPMDKRLIKLQSVKTYAPSNIALCKYWGKRDTLLNLPFNSSLSISLKNYGASTKLTITNEKSDEVILNGRPIDQNTIFYQRATQYLDLFRFDKKNHFRIEIAMNIPQAAGLASSACGFATLILALDKIYQWNLDKKQLSLLARLGSGSACRSLWNGFVIWQAGKLSNGTDSYAKPLKTTWTQLRLGLLIVSKQPKKISSRDAMLVDTSSSAYQRWLEQSKNDLTSLKLAIKNKNFIKLGTVTEENSQRLHTLIATTLDGFNYSLPQTSTWKQKVWQLRETGLPIYFTQDAGPNLKLLFQNERIDEVNYHFPGIITINPW